jgi:tRNA threonylcarbamoyl adenosine modification protein YeaZ
MLQLALETIGQSGSLAVLDGQTVRWSHALAADRRAAADLAVQLDAALRWAESQAIRFDVISVASGPGSFTGLRVGITTAKSLAYAMDLPVLPVGSMATLAMALSLSEQSVPVAVPPRVLVGLNAYRNQVFRAEFTAEELVGGRGRVSDWADRAEVVERAAWDAEVRRLAESHALADVWITGDRRLVGGAGQMLWRPRRVVDAVGVGLAASRLAAAVGWPGNPAAADQLLRDPFSLAANYVKPSAAEEQATSR